MLSIFLIESIPLIILVLFLAAYLAVMLEERTHLRKSIPMSLTAGVLWILASIHMNAYGRGDEIIDHLRETFLEFSELFFFLLSAVTFVNALENRSVFSAFRSYLESKNFSLRTVFWITGALAFVMSPIADNLTTTLVVGSVAISAGRGSPRFIAAACVSIVVAANAGGVFSPFGDITTLMVWQRGVVDFFDFFQLFLPALVNWLIPAAILSVSFSNSKPAVQAGRESFKPGAIPVLCLFLFTIAGTVILHHITKIPAVVGMMTGFACLHLYSYITHRSRASSKYEGVMPLSDISESGDKLDVFRLLQGIEWDTLIFFYGAILSVGALGAIGYLDTFSTFLFDSVGIEAASIIIGVVSGLVDNIPLMYSILAVEPDFNQFQWLLLTLAAGVGGSLLSIGSAAGVALMGHTNGVYSSAGHLKWTWAVLLGYAASIALHFVLN